MHIRYLWITIFLLIASPLLALEAQAAVYWTKLNENKQSKLSIDKQTIIEKDQLKKSVAQDRIQNPAKKIYKSQKKHLIYLKCFGILIAQHKNLPQHKWCNI